MAPTAALLQVPSSAVAKPRVAERAQASPGSVKGEVGSLRYRPGGVVACSWAAARNGDGTGARLRWS